jgi:hypothetical protein
MWIGLDTELRLRARVSTPDRASSRGCYAGLWQTAPML